jgi:hypothetical protein
MPRIRIRLQALLVGAASGALCVGLASRDAWAASASLGDQIRARGLGYPVPKVIEPQAQLKLADGADWKSVQIQETTLRDRHATLTHRMLTKIVFFLLLFQCRDTRRGHSQLERASARLASNDIEEAFLKWTCLPAAEFQLEAAAPIVFSSLSD